LVGNHNIGPAAENKDRDTPFLCPAQQQRHKRKKTVRARLYPESRRPSYFEGSMRCHSFVKAEPAAKRKTVQETPQLASFNNTSFNHGIRVLHRPVLRNDA
jgi:hypothetical protein